MRQGMRNRRSWKSKYRFARMQGLDAME